MHDLQFKNVKHIHDSNTRPGCVISFKTSQFTLIGGIVELKELRFRNPHTHLIIIQIEISVWELRTEAMPWARQLLMDLVLDPTVYHVYKQKIKKDKIHVMLKFNNQ